MGQVNSEDELDSSPIGLVGIVQAFLYFASFVVLGLLGILLLLLALMYLQSQQVALKSLKPVLPRYDWRREFQEQQQALSFSLDPLGVDFKLVDGRFTRLTFISLEQLTPAVVKQLALSVSTLDKHLSDNYVWVKGEGPILDIRSFESNRTMDWKTGELNPSKFAAVFEAWLRQSRDDAAYGRNQYNENPDPAKPLRDFAALFGPRPLVKKTTSFSANQVVNTVESNGSSPHLGQSR